MRRSSVAVAVLSALIVLLSASAAGAHAVFVGAPSGFPTDTDQTLTLNVPHERNDVTYNVDVLVAMPAGWNALSCQNKPTWTCSLGTVDGRQVVRFTKGNGTEVAEDETFQFAVRTASTVGTFAFPTVQTYSTGEIVRWIGATGTGNPAPTLATLAGGTVPQSTPSTTNPDAPPTTSPVVTAPATSVATTIAPTTTVAPATSAGTGTSTTFASATTASPSSSTTTTLATIAVPNASGDDDGASSVPLVVGLIVIVAVAAGGLLAYRRQSHSRRRNNT